MEIELKDDVFNDLKTICTNVYNKGERVNIYSLMEVMMDHSQVPMHFPYHHFIMPASLLTAAAGYLVVAMKDGEKFKQGDVLGYIVDECEA